MDILVDEMNSCYTIMSFQMQLKLTSIEFVDAADPSQATRWQIVEGKEVVIAWKAMDGANANFVETPKEVFGNVHGLLEILHPNVDASHDSNNGWGFL